MNSTAPVLEKAQNNAEDLPIDRPRKSGFVLKPIDVDGAIAMLNSFYEDGDEEEQRETFEELRQALNEGRRKRGERLLFEGSVGLILRRPDRETAKTLLSELDEFDGDEQRETLAYLKKALNETRAAQGARLIFPDDKQ